MIATKFENRGEIGRESKKKKKKNPRGVLRINSKGNNTNNMMNVYHFMLGVNKVFKG